MFSFDLQEEVDLSIWKTLRNTLPTAYRIPDISFLCGLHPKFPMELIETRDWLVPDKWKSETMVQHILPDLPHGYQIPDQTLLKRMFDAL
jgi:hypothetical protein